VSSKPNIFDRIRVRPPDHEPEGPRCEWPSCARTATHRAPKGRGRDGQYFGFCVEHVRDYNKTYNYFDGMNATDFARYQKEGITGHRPTWKLGINGQPPSGPAHAGNGIKDAFSFFAGTARTPGPVSKAKPVGNAARKALDTLGLDAGVAGQDIKTRYKALVKRHHPDANGGTRDAEDRLVEIIKAYRYLRGAGFC
jgi:DnaJ-domain-containing protein 1